MPLNSTINNLVWSKLSQDWLSDRFDYNNHINLLLALGLKILDLDVAIISNIVDKRYIVQHSVGGELERGQEFNLGHTYCSITTNQKQLVAIYNMGISEHFRHPCYEIFKLESYIGVPIALNGEPYGTLNFSSVKPRTSQFGDEEQAVVRLLGETVNWALLAQHSS